MRPDGPGAAGCLRYVEAVMAPLKIAGSKDHLLTAQVGPGDLRLGDAGHGLNCSEVLGPDPRLGTSGPDAFHPDRRPG
jgi:hypothetical protein